MKVAEKNFPCPSCGFEVFSERPGSYEICELCGWEDDHVQLRFPAMAGGANKSSLARHQLQALAAYPINVSVAKRFSSLQRMAASPCERDCVAALAVFRTGVLQCRCGRRCAILLVESCIALTSRSFRRAKARRLCSQHRGGGVSLRRRDEA